MAQGHDGKECKRPAAPSIGVLGTIVKLYYVQYLNVYV